MKIIGRIMSVKTLAASAVVLAAGCDGGSGPGESPGTTLVGVEWRLVAIETGDSSMSPQGPEDRAPSVTFTDEAAGDDGAFRLGGSGGCNRYFGGYKAEPDGALTISAVGSTEMYCAEPGVMDLESTFLGSLTKTTSYRISEGELVIAFDGGVMRLEAASLPESAAGG